MFCGVPVYSWGPALEKIEKEKREGYKWHHNE